MSGYIPACALVLCVCVCVCVFVCVCLCVCVCAGCVCIFGVFLLVKGRISSRPVWFTSDHTKHATKQSLTRVCVCPPQERTLMDSFWGGHTHTHTHTHAKYICTYIQLHAYSHRYT